MANPVQAYGIIVLSMGHLVDPHYRRGNDRSVVGRWSVSGIHEHAIRIKIC